MVRIALAAGHHNHSGGNAEEKALVGPVTKALASALRARGFDVRVITPAEGEGTFPGSLNQVAAKVVEWANAGWVAQLFLEVHGEANGGGNAVRGAFAIYPDWGMDVDIEVRDRLGPALAKAIKEGTGIPVRGRGVMSEKQTAVGLSGARLGIFKATVPVRATTTRTILEIGSYTAPADRAILFAPGFPDRIAPALADALVDYYGMAPTPVTDAAVIGVQPSISLKAFQAVIRDHGQTIPIVEASRIYDFCGWLEVDPAFLLALWKAEAGSPLGGSVLQQQTRMPINRKTFKWPGRLSVAYKGEEWEAWPTWQLGLMQSVLVLKTHGDAGRTTVRQIIPVHAPASDGNDVERIIGEILTDMAYMQRRPQ